MSTADDDAVAFEAERPRLTRLAYSITGSIADAEDCVQEAWLRLHRLDAAFEIRDLPAWLTTAVGRLALDALRRTSARRETYVGPWLPEPIVEHARSTPDPADRVTLDESVSMALLVVLERLSAAERTAFVLHDVFGQPFEEVARVVGRSPAAVRQLASRARVHVQRGRPRFEATADEQRAVVEAFVAACDGGDLDALTRLLADDVVWRGDGGGRVPTNRIVIGGQDAVARGLLGFAAQTRQNPDANPRMVRVNGAPGLVLHDRAGVLTVIAFTIDAGLIAAVDVMRNPDKLRAVRLDG